MELNKNAKLRRYTKEGLAMQDHIIITACIQVIGLWLLDYVGIHQFPMESLLTLVSTFYLMWMHGLDKDDKK